MESWVVGAGDAQRVVAKLTSEGGTGAEIEIERIGSLSAFVTGPPPDGVGRVLGMSHDEVAAAFGPRTECEGAPALCQLALADTEAGYANTFVEFADGRAHKVHWVIESGQGFLVGRAYAAYVASFRAPTTSEVDGDTYVRFAAAPSLKLWIRSALPNHGLFCVGACPEYEPATPEPGR